MIEGTKSPKAMTIYAIRAGGGNHTTGIAAVKVEPGAGYMGIKELALADISQQEPEFR